MKIFRMSHPDPNGAPDLRPIEVGEVWENSVTRERGKILELPYKNPEGRATTELTAPAGARDLRRPRTDCALARLSRDLPAALAHGASAAAILIDGSTSKERRARSGGPRPIEQAHEGLPVGFSECVSGWRPRIGERCGSVG